MMFGGEKLLPIMTKFRVIAIGFRVGTRTKLGVRVGLGLGQQ